MPIQRKAVILLSGGLDSATVLAIARAERYLTYALTVRYGQPHPEEIDAANRVAAQLQVRAHAVLDVDLSPLQRDGVAVGAGATKFYIPARNTIFLAFALSWAETLGSNDIFIGVNPATDEYSDRRSEFLAVYESLARFAVQHPATGEHVHIHTPLDGVSKADVIRTGLRLGVDYTLTHTCFEPTAAGRACGDCSACIGRAKGFAEVGLPDPALSDLSLETWGRNLR